MIHCINSALKARILLKADVSENGPGWSDERIAEALETVSQRFFAPVASLSKPWMPHCHARRVPGHPLGFLTERQRLLRWPVRSLRKAIPVGRCRCWKSVWWNWGLLRRPVTPQSFGYSKKTKPHKKKCWVIPPKMDKAFVIAMENILKIYSFARPGPSTGVPGRNFKAIDLRQARAFAAPPGT